MDSESPLMTIVLAAYFAGLWTLLLLGVWWPVSWKLKRSPQFGHVGLSSLIAAFLLGELTGILTPVNRLADNPFAAINNSLMLGAWLGAFLGATWSVMDGSKQLRRLGWQGFGRNLLQQLIAPPQQRESPQPIGSARLNFSGQDCRRRSFSRQVLNGANFQNANLEGVDFSHARLIGANFQGAIAPNANFNHCHIAGTTFNGATLENAIFSYAIGFVPGWRYSDTLLRRWTRTAPAWVWILLGYGFASLTFLWLFTPRARLMLLGLLLACVAMLFILVTLGFWLLTQWATLSGIAVVALMVNTSYLLSVHPTKSSLPVAVEVVVVLAAGAIALLALAQKRWLTFGCGFGMLCGSSAVALFPMVFRDQIPLPLLYSGIFSAWGLAIGHLAGIYFERGICHFRQANLTGASFSHARLSFANFRDATVTQAKFSHATTQGANFTASNQS
ncbi:pentapeptide repeat-containing protein [Vacuolonema iberomarrocanum]|uniref:pentapeptide repeat-containing protein n=1 Tax=Vacuolonema iberomarrocanum TaxID=3454632 RepID=UPI0019EA60DB|nr:pentapeptide repeat-containing protein [filamentous cyanobacterium LEGE 07170]